MDKMVSGMGGMTLNPNAAEFVPAALKPRPNVESSGSNKGSTQTRVFNRTDSANSGTSDDESRQYWKDQLPDDIIPDFRIVPQAGDDRFDWEHAYMEERGSGIFSELVGEGPMLETGEVIDPVDLLVNEFPGFAAQSLADILSANGGDLSLTIEMLTQLELQDDIVPVRQLQSQIQTPNLNMMDFPALAGPEFADGTPQSDGDINAQHLLRTQRAIGFDDLFTSRSYASGGGFRGAATDFAAAVRKNSATTGAQWQPDRNGRIERFSQAEDFRATNGEKLGSFSSSRRHSPPVWLETGEAVSNMYADLREEARDHARVRNAYFEQARQAYLSGNKALAKELSAKGQWHNGLMKDAHSKAGETIFQQRNLSTGGSSQGTQLLDLHGLHVNEAIPLLKRELAVLRAAARSTQQRQQILICVGTGHHTKGSRTPARLPIAVEKFLAEDEHLPYTEQQPGMLRVLLS